MRAAAARASPKWVHLHQGPRPRALAVPLPRQALRGVLARHHDDDDDVLPIISGRRPSQEAPTSLPKPQLLGGKTIGDELGIIHESMQEADRRADKRMEAKLYSGNWQGDVYTGSSWNMLSFLMALVILVPLLGLLGAYLSYGTLWTGHYYGM